MIRSLFNRGKKIAGVEIVLQGEDKLAIHLVTGNVRNNFFDVEVKQIGLTSVDQIKDYVDLDTQLHFIISGKGILNKLLPSPTDGEDEDAINNVIPNANPDDFYIQVVRSGANRFLSVIRREILDSILDRLNQAGHFILQMELSPIATYPELVLLQPEVSEIYFAGHSLTFSQGILQHYQYAASEKNEKKLPLGEEELEEQLITSFLAAFKFVSNTDSHGFLSERIALQKQEWIQKRMYKKLIVVVPLFFVIVLFVNFIFYQKYFSESNQLQSRNALAQRLIKKQESLQHDIQLKEEFMLKFGWSSKARNSYLIDRLAATVQGNIQLLELSVNPLEEKQTKKEKYPVFASGKIKATGLCSNPTRLSEWIKMMKALDWVNDVSIQQYGLSENNSMGNFFVSIEVK
jgi:hypothetical protein